MPMAAASSSGVVAGLAHTAAGCGSGTPQDSPRNPAPHAHVVLSAAWAPPGLQGSVSQYTPSQPSRQVHRPPLQLPCPTRLM
jgi:hypothetical protein